MQPPSYVVLVSDLFQLGISKSVCNLFNCNQTCPFYPSNERCLPLMFYRFFFHFSFRGTISNFISRIEMSSVIYSSKKSSYLTIFILFGKIYFFIWKNSLGKFTDNTRTTDFIHMNFHYFLIRNTNHKPLNFPLRLK